MAITKERFDNADSNDTKMLKELSMLDQTTTK